MTDEPTGSDNRQLPYDIMTQYLTVPSSLIIRSQCELLTMEVTEAVVLKTMLCVVGRVVTDVSKDGTVVTDVACCDMRLPQYKWKAFWCSGI